MDGNRWGAIEHLTASLLDLTAIQRIETRVIGGDKKPPTFAPVERPGAKARAKAAEVEAAKRVDLLRRKPKGGSGG